MKQWDEWDTFIFVFQTLKNKKEGKRKNKRTKYKKSLK